MSDRLAIGGNGPPAFEAISLALEDAHTEALNFLDGGAIENQGQADAIGRIVSEVKRLRKDADEKRAEEKRPHDEAGKAVQTKWKPVLERADDIGRAAQAPLTAYLHRLEAEQREAARIARAEADRLAQEAIQAERAASGDLAATEAARALTKAASTAAKDANRAEKAKAHVTGAERAIGLRQSWVSVITDRRELLAHVMRHDPDALTEFLAEYARKHAGPAQLPGVETTLQRKVA